MVRLASNPARQPPMRGGRSLTIHLVQVSLFCLGWSTQPAGLPTGRKHPNHSISMLLTSAGPRPKGSAQATGISAGREGILAEGLWSLERAPLLTEAPGRPEAVQCPPALNPSESSGVPSLLSVGIGGDFQELYHLNRTGRGRLNHTVLLRARIAIIHSVVT